MFLLPKKIIKNFHNKSQVSRKNQTIFQNKPIIRPKIETKNYFYNKNICNFLDFNIMN